MLSLRVPCDAQLSRRDVKLGLRPQTTHPFSPAQSPLLGKPERDLKVNIQGSIVGAPSRRDSVSSVLDNPKEDKGQNQCYSFWLVLHE